MKDLVKTDWNESRVQKHHGSHTNRCMFIPWLSLVERGARNARVVGLIPTGDQYENACMHSLPLVALDKSIC